MSGVFLDSSVVRILSLSNHELAALLTLPALGIEMELVTSSYVLREVCDALADEVVPPKARIATLLGLAVGIQTAWRVRLEEPKAEALVPFQDCCRDETDWPILADATAEGCEVILTRDRDLLESTCSIPCERPEAWLQALFAQERVKETVERFAATLEPEVSPQLPNVEEPPADSPPG